jgi:hypothetical protein
MDIFYTQPVQLHSFCFQSSTCHLFFWKLDIFVHLKQQLCNSICDLLHYVMAVTGTERGRFEGEGEGGRGAGDNRAKEGGIIPATADVDELMNPNKIWSNSRTNWWLPSNTLDTTLMKTPLWTNVYWTLHLMLIIPSNTITKSPLYSYIIPKYTIILPW